MNELTALHDQLLATKFFVPSFPHALILRPRLLELLTSKSLECKLRPLSMNGTKNNAKELDREIQINRVSMILLKPVLLFSDAYLGSWPQLVNPPACW